ncbi:DNA-binding protein [Vibrio clamense]|uniref:DNA-binding protein n=1 Tax=Vibrio clamense TaxID=2910254 RepID=UPI003D25C6A3
MKAPNSSFDEIHFYTLDERIERGKKGCLVSGSKPYSDLENQFLIDNFSRLTQVQIAKHIGRRVCSVNNRVKALFKLGLLKDNRTWLRVPFSKEEDDFIIENRGILSVPQVAKVLGRPESSVQYRASRLNVSYRKISNESPVAKLSSEDVELIRELVDLGLTHSEVADKFDVVRSHVTDIVNFNRRLYKDFPDYFGCQARQVSAIDGQD